MFAKLLRNQKSPLPYLLITNEILTKAANDQLGANLITSNWRCDNNTRVSFGDISFFVSRGDANDETMQLPPL